MAKKKADTVSVTALKYHTHEGEEHQEGDTYDVAPEAVDNLVVIGFVRRPDAAAAPAKKSTAVEPMTTDNTPLAPTEPE